jgi:hypothetical protein
VSEIAHHINNQHILAFHINHINHTNQGSDKKPAAALALAAWSVPPKAAVRSTERLASAERSGGRRPQRPNQSKINALQKRTGVLQK